jgi:hypothetical protein
VDRICRRQISARLFLRPEKQFSIRICKDSVRFGIGKRGQRHGFSIRNIHCTTKWNLLLLIRGTCATFSFGNVRFVGSFSLRERASDRNCLRDSGEHSRRDVESVDPAVDAELKNRRSSLGADRFHDPVDSLRQRIPLHSFHRFHVAGGNCLLPLSHPNGQNYNRLTIGIKVNLFHWIIIRGENSIKLIINKEQNDNLAPFS